MRDCSDYAAADRDGGRAKGAGETWEAGEAAVSGGERRSGEEQEAWKAGHAVVRTLKAAGHDAYLVGGCVRDRLLGRALHDVDIASSALPEEVMALFPSVIPTGLKHGTVTVKERGMLFEVTTFRQESGYSDSRRPDEVAFVKDIRDDLARRDFTINAIAAGADGGLVDPFGGAADLKRGVVRCVGLAEKRFGEDALRMLRGVRFAAEFGFELDKATYRGMLAQREKLACIAMERVGAELDKMIGGSRPERAVALLAATGLLGFAKEPLELALPAPARLRRLRKALDAGADVPADLRWALLFALADADAAAADRTLRTLRYSVKRAARIAAVVGLHRALRSGGGAGVPGGEGRAGGTRAVAAASGKAAARGAALTREAWTRAVLAYGAEAAAAWLRLVRLLPDEGGSGAAAADAAAQAERAGEWLARLPAKRIADLAVRGDEVVKAAGRPPGPWVADALGRLLERVALERLPNERDPLLAALAEVMTKEE